MDRRSESELPPPAPDLRDRPQSGVRILRPEAPGPPPAPEPEPDERRVEDLEGAAAPDAPERSAPPRSKRNQVVGVNIANGVAYLAAVDASGRSLLQGNETIAPPAEGEEDGVRLSAFSKAIGQALRANDAGVVAVARPVRYTNWTYADAFERVSLETCIVLEAQAAGVRFESVGQHHAANVIGLPLERLGDLLSSRLAVAKTRSWPDRWPALLVALATKAA